MCSRRADFGALKAGVRFQKTGVNSSQVIICTNNPIHAKTLGLTFFLTTKIVQFDDFIAQEKLSDHKIVWFDDLVALLVRWRGPKIGLPQ